LNEMISGIGKNLVKREGIKRGKGRNPVNSPMTDIGIAIIGRIGTTEIAIGIIGTGTGIGKGKEIGVVIVTEYATVIETEVGSVVATMSVIDTETVIGNVIVVEKGRVRENWKLKTMTVTRGGPVIGSLLMIKLNQNMRGGTDIAKGSGTMIALNPRMIMGGMNSPSMSISIQIKTMTLSTMSIVEVGDSMIIWMSLMTLTATINILIEWRRMITIMSVQHLSHVKGRKLEMWSVNIDAQRDHFLGSTSTETASISQLVLLLFWASFNQRSGVFLGATSFCMDVGFSFSLLTKTLCLKVYD
jgi:hypothetical protein